MIQSPSDSKVYRLITLKNDLEVLLIQRPKEDGDENETASSSSEDSENDNESEDEDSGNESEDGNGNNSKQASVALSVGIGSYCDGVEVPGLAHFLEHMLFMGSEKYPKENAFESFLSKHGGESNGMTESEHTVYMYEIHPDFLKPSLDIFAQLFIAPLFRKEACERERHAIESEFRQAQQNDAVRLEQIIRHTTNDTLLSQCGWGNESSLAGTTVPAAMETLFHSKYSSNLMKLVIQGHDTIDEMESWVREMFSEIVNHNVKIPTFNIPETYPWPVQNMLKKTVFNIVPVKDIHFLNLHWFLPSQVNKYRSNPVSYLEHLIGHESTGSILEELQKRGWATGISAGMNAEDGFENGSIAAVFGIQVDLTETGIDVYPEVLKMVLSYIAFLQETVLPKWIYTELQQIAKVQFQFREESTPIDYVTELSSAMQDRYGIDRNDLLRYDDLLGPFQPEEIQELLEMMTPTNVRIDLATSSIKDKVDVEWQIEPWFESRYFITNDLNLEMVMVSDDIQTPLWTFPRPNSFVPTHFDLLPLNDNVKEDVPTLFHETEQYTLYYAVDSHFRLPKCNVCFILATKAVHVSVEMHLVAVLMVRMVKEALTSVAYQASLAELNYELAVVDSGIELIFSGFSDTLLALITMVVSTLTDPSSFCTRHRFEMCKEELSRHYKNANLKSLRHATYVRLQLIKDLSMSYTDRSMALDVLTFDKVQEVLSSRILFQNVFVQALVHGNWNTSLAKCTVETIVSSLKQPSPVQPLCVTKKKVEFEYPQDLVVQLSPGTIRITQQAVHEKDVNNVVHYYYQIGARSIEDEALVELLEAIMTEPLFDTLRTKEQLGYTVFGSCHWTSGILGFSLTVQSSEFGVQHVQERISSFLAAFQVTLLSLSDFDTHVTSRIHALSEPDSNLSEVTQRHWDQILCRYYHFNAAQEKVAFLKNTTLSTLIAKVQIWFGETSRALQVHVVANNSKDVEEVSIFSTARGVTNVSMNELSTYKKDLSRYTNCV